MAFTATKQRAIIERERCKLLLDEDFFEKRSKGATKREKFSSKAPKTIQATNHFCHFCSQVVTFQQFNPRVARYHYKRRLPPHVSRSRWELAQDRNNSANVQQVPSVQQANLINQVESYQSSDQFQQPRTFHTKMRQIFSRFRRSEKLNRHSNVDVEAQNETENGEFYHFDHGQPTYYRTTDCPPHLTSDIVAQRVNETFTKFWAEFFGYINVLVTLVITFLVQFYR
jgi:hypothetical protein